MICYLYTTTQLAGAATACRWSKDDRVAYRPSRPVNLQVRIAREFVPPGDVIWLERCKPLPYQRGGGYRCGVTAQQVDAAGAPSGRTSGGALAAALPLRRPAARLCPHLTDGLNLVVGGMVVSRQMFSDHVPDTQFAQLRRLVRRLQRQRRAAVASAATAQIGATGGITGAANLTPPPVQAMPRRTPTVKFAL